MRKISKKHGHLLANLLVLILNLLMAFVAFKAKAWIPSVIAAVVSIMCIFSINED